MIHKQITHADTMFDHILEGVGEVASIVGRTLGPGGLPILIQRRGEALNGEPLGPMITKDGVTVAAECESPDPLVDIVIQAVKDICRKTNRIAGDGTTTAIVLGDALLHEAVRSLVETGTNPQQIRRDIERVVEEVTSMLQAESIPCKSFDMIEHVAKISANGDKEISSVVRAAFEAVGVEGLITVDEGGSRNHTLEVVDGFQFRRGAEAQDRFFNNTDRTRFEAENAHVLLYDGKLMQPAQVIDVLKLLWDKYQGKMPPVVFVASEFSSEALQAMLINRAENGLSVCAVRSPHQTKVSTVMLDDVAVFLGGERLGNGNRSLSNIEFEDIGIAEKVSIDKYTTTFFNGAGSEEAVTDRIKQLKAQREVSTDIYEQGLISDRIASLAEGIAKVCVGGATDFEVKEKYHRIEDAINAARAAIAEGVIPGGGATLYRISLQLLARKGDAERIVGLALRAPMQRILENLGEQDMPAIFARTQVAGTTYDGVSRSIVNAVEAGIIDPVKVTKTALRNACSIATLLATCGGAITYTRE